ncbi:MAG: ribonuclease Z [Flavobacteriales bacterium]
MNFDITILGCGAATPTGRHNPSSQVLDIHDKLFMIDCGEGTQMELRKRHIKIQRVQHIFISHLHGDHYLGLIGLLSSLHLLGRKSELTVFGPPELKELLDLSFKVSQTFIEYPLHFVALSQEKKKLIYEDKTIEVYSFPLKHRIPTCGFQFVEKEKSPKIRKSIISKYDLKPSEIIFLKKNKAVTLESGRVVEPAEACIPAERSRSYSYCSDTAYWETLVDSIKGTDLLYHESTFLDSEKERAKTTFHSTARQAAKIARLAEVRKLVLGHFSSRYSDELPFLEQALEEFPCVELAEEGKTFSIPL